MKWKRRFQKMQALERPEHSAEGISFLTARNVYEWRKKPYTTMKMEQQASGGREDQDQSLLSLKEREMTFSHQRLQDMY